MYRGALPVWYWLKSGIVAAFLLSLIKVLDLCGKGVVKHDSLFYYLCEMKSWTIKINYYDAEGVPEDQRWIGTVLGEEFRGTVEAGGSLPDVLRELATSVEILLAYRNNLSRQV